jgi:hypothetical protein
VDSSEIEKLEMEIESLRKEMMEVGLKKGLSHSHTIYLSQKLDQLLNLSVAQKSKNAS